MWWAMETPLPSMSKHAGEHAARKVLMAWVLHANAEGIAWPSYERLAEKSGIHQWTVQYVVREFEKAGVLGRVTRSGIGTRAIARQALSGGEPVLRPADNSPSSVGMPTDRKGGLSVGLSVGSSVGMPTRKKKVKEKGKKENSKERFGGVPDHPLPSDEDWRAFLKQVETESRVSRRKEAQF